MSRFMKNLLLAVMIFLPAFSVGAFDAVNDRGFNNYELAETVVLDNSEAFHASPIGSAVEAQNVKGFYLAVPEPSSCALVTLGILGLLAVYKHRSSLSLLA